MTNSLRAVRLGGALLLSVTNVLRAQDKHARQGIWFGLGLGYGARNNICTAPCQDSSRVSGTTISVRFGGTPSPQLRVAAAVDAWTNRANDVTQTLGNVTGSVLYYPQLKSGWFLEAGLGISNYRLETDPVVTQTGWGVTFATGIDFPVSETVSLTPRAVYSYGAIGQFPGSGPEKWNQNVIALGLGLTFSGRHD